MTILQAPPDFSTTPTIHPNPQKEAVLMSITYGTDSPRFIDDVFDPDPLDDLFEFALSPSPCYETFYDRPAEPDPVGGTEPVHVWRVEHHDNDAGPYNFDATLLTREEYDRYDHAFYEHDCGDDYHIAPQHHGLVMGWGSNHPNTICGFPSEAAMHRWFEGTSLDDLLAARFEIHEYEVDPEHVWVWPEQCAFDREFARRVA